MKIVHISDIHLTENGTEIWGVNTHEHFQKAIQKIKELDGLDGIIVSGDLSNDGSKWTYEYIDRALKGSVSLSVSEASSLKPVDL
uniref:metallophosphoesterase family protein n=1 Tax=Bacteroides acidifaciens TaxID=85831 RepID=UPI0025581F04